MSVSGVEVGVEIGVEVGVEVICHSTFRSRYPFKKGIHIKNNIENTLHILLEE